MTTPAGSKKNSTTKWIAGAGIALAAVVAAVLVLTNGGETDDRELASNADTVPTTRAADTTAPATSVVGDTATTDTTASSTSSPTVATFVYPAIGNVAFLDGLALGWWDGTTWNEMPSGYDGPVTDPPLFDAQTVRYVDPAGQIVARGVSPLTEQCTEVGNQWTVGDDRATEGLVGTSGEWELRPREVVEIAADEAHLQSV